MKSTASWLSVWKKWCLEKRIAEEIENYEPADLNTLLERFYAEIRNKHGEDYEPESLKVIIASLDGHLKNKGYRAYPLFATENSVPPNKLLREIFQVDRRVFCS